MEFCGFETKTVTYPDAAGGWCDGVYHERKARVVDGGGLSYISRRFREREETGWGVYDYREGTSFSFSSGYCDLIISARVRAEENCRLDVFCDGVCVLSGADVASDENGTELSFVVRSCSDVSELMFSPAYEGDKEESVAALTVMEISAERVPLLEAGRKPTVFLASDSTVQTYDQYYYPQTGWGEVFYKYFRLSELVRELCPEGSTYSQCRAYELPEVTIENRAIGGRSAKSFYLEGELSELFSRAREGDLIFIQFGHNDCTKARPNRYSPPEEYRSFIEKYIRAALSRKMTPVLVTPVMRRNCREGGREGTFAPSFPEFAEQLHELSAEFEIPLLDLGAASLRLCEALGEEKTKKLYLHAEAGDFPGAYEKGVADNTHLSRTGALLYAGLAAGLLADSKDERLATLSSLVEVTRIEEIRRTLIC